MPYKEVYVKPQKFLRHRKIDVYRTYKDNQADNYNIYHFSLDPVQESEYFGIHRFDIRELPEYKEPVQSVFLDWDNHFKGIIRKAIDNNSIPYQKEWGKKQIDIALNKYEYEPDS